MNIPPGAIKDAFICELCKKIFPEETLLISHLCVFKKKETDAGESNLEYSLALSVCKNDSIQPQNISSQANKDAFICELCKKIFPEETLLISHPCVFKKKETDAGESSLEYFLALSDCRNHSIQPQNEKDIYICGVCNKVLKRKENCVRHLRLHSGEKPFSCEICQKRFPHQYNLINHLRVHTQEKPFVCGICQKQFAQSSCLIKHNRIHTGEKPYSCEICPRKFSRKFCLEIHMRNHTHDKPFVCDICQKTFAQKSNLNVHYRIHSRS